MEDLGLDAGMVVNMEVVGRGAHLRSDVRVIGYLPGQSVLLTMPESDLVASAIAVDTACIVRYLHRTTVAAFRTPVIAIAARPYPHLHLRYPAQVDRVMVRRAERVAAGLPVSVHAGEDDPSADPLAATLADLSTGGARVVAERGLGSRGQRLRLRFGLTFSGMHRDMEVAAIVRNLGGRSAAGPGIAGSVTGVEFVDLGRDEQIFLSGFVYEELVRRRNSPP